MKIFINELLVRYRRILDTPLDPEQLRDLRERLNSLRLGFSVLTKLELNESNPRHLPHITILGPTQAGKSTLVNLLSATNVAGVSPLAGYTVHAQGFSSATSDTELAHVSSMFNDFTQVSAKSLSSENLESYSIEMIGDKFAPLPTVALWDSPDFDSVDSTGYRSAVLRVAALADVIILMVSKDKYADKAVWDILSLVMPLNKPMVVCINKLSESDNTTVINSFSRRYREIFGVTEPAIVAIPFATEIETPESLIAQESREALMRQISSSLEQVDRQAQRLGAFQLIDQHWDTWLEPALNERAAKERWQLEVNAAIEEGMQRYRDGYLNHPQKYDTFNRAIAELLTFLEIPGIAGALGKTRKVVTWPLRKLFSLGQSVINKDSDKPIVPTELEDDILHQAHAHVITSLSNVALDLQQENGDQLQWWSLMANSIRAERESSNAQFQQAIDNYQLSFVPEIEAAAQQLFSKLQDQPALLNTLRVARVSTDAAAVVLAVKSGGLAATDLVVAPAMLSLTTMLTEGVLGKYMDSIKADLKSRQAAIVHKELFENILKSYLYKLPDTLNDKRLFMLDEKQIQDAQKKLRAAL